eukprot:32623-Pelagomonas_calceolata.AAC.1
MAGIGFFDNAPIQWLLSNNLRQTLLDIVRVNTSALFLTYMPNSMAATLSCAAAIIMLLPSKNFK